LKDKLYKTLKIQITDVGMLEITLSQNIVNVYEETKITEQLLIQEINNLNLLLQYYQANVSVAYINSQRIRNIADINYSITKQNADYTALTLSSELEYLKKTIESANNVFNLTTTIVNDSDNYTASNILLAYYYT